MNKYSVKFFARCPTNGIRIEYLLEIRTDQTIMVEDILEAVQFDTGYHERIADNLSARFGGIQTLSAVHHGVTIETTRSQK